MDMAPLVEALEGAAGLGTEQVTATTLMILLLEQEPVLGGPAPSSRTRAATASLAAVTELPVEDSVAHLRGGSAMGTVVVVTPLVLPVPGEAASREVSEWPAVAAGVGRERVAGPLLARMPEVAMLHLVDRCPVSDTEEAPPVDFRPAAVGGGLQLACGPAAPGVSRAPGVVERRAAQFLASPWLVVHPGSTVQASEAEA